MPTAETVSDGPWTSSDAWISTITTETEYPPISDTETPLTISYTSEPLTYISEMTSGVPTEFPTEATSEHTEFLTTSDQRTYSESSTMLEWETSTEHDTSTPFVSTDEPITFTTEPLMSFSPEHSTFLTNSTSVFGTEAPDIATDVTDTTEFPTNFTTGSISSFTAEKWDPDMTTNTPTNMATVHTNYTTTTQSHVTNSSATTPKITESSTKSVATTGKPIGDMYVFKVTLRSSSSVESTMKPLLEKVCTLLSPHFNLTGVRLSIAGNSTITNTCARV
ncbi:uncharacterized protein [Pyxicephalus adspersus]|uniref:uncharacterized protein n=1 Tax=Pyxicephalus adspersus TaxID=30357 RepID=UPI003B5B690C